MRLTKAQSKMLQCERVSRVATVGGSGVPHLVPVCHVLVGDKIYFGSGRKGRKVLNVAANPRLALTVDVYSDDWDHITGVMVQGRARVIERGPRFRRLRSRVSTPSTRSTRATPRSANRTPSSSRSRPRMCSPGNPYTPAV